jgi:pilus assembly protein CpaB
MTRRLITIGLAVLLAVLGTAGVLLYVKQADARALAGQQAVTVLIAEKRVPQGTSAKDAEDQGLLRTDKLPAASVPDGALTSIDAGLESLVASAEIPAGMVVLRPMLVPAAQIVSGVAIPDGKIAITVSVDAQERVGGLVQVGSKVAVFDTFNVLDGHGITPSGDGLQERYEYNKATRLLLPSVEVIGIRMDTIGTGSSGRQAVADDETAQTTVKALVTFAVDQVEAEKLIHAQQTGALYLALLGTNPNVAPSGGVDNRSIFGNGG